MGIKGLFPFLREHAPKAVTEIQSQQNYNGRILAIDASTCLYQFIVAIRTGTGESYQNLTNDKGEITSHLSGFLNRTIRLLEAGCKPVYVFDGKAPSLKSGELANRKARKAQAAAEYEKAKEEGDAEKMQKMADRNVSVTREMTEQTKKLLRLMGVPVVEAPCEAEATCAHFSKTGNCYAAATEDADALCFGAKYLVKNLFTTDIKKKPMLEIDLQRVLTQLDVDMNRFIDFCILSGCDYTDTITGVGNITAFQLVRQHGSIEKILETAIAKDKVPTNFPFDEARDLFNKHEVPDVNEIDPATGKKKYDFKAIFASKPKPDMAGLRKFLVEENQFNEDRIKSQLEKLQKGLNQGMQLSFDMFFTMEAAPIKDNDKFDPFKKKGGAKRANRTAALATAADDKAEPKLKKRKGALTAAKLEEQDKEKNKAAASASSSSSTTTDATVKIISSSPAHAGGNGNGGNTTSTDPAPAKLPDVLL